MRLIVRAILWFGLYVVMIIFPLLASAVFADPGTSPGLIIDFAIALGYIGLSLMAAELALVSRFAGAAGAFGLDSLLQFHRQIGIAAMGVVILHPLLLVADAAYTRVLLVPSPDAPWPVTMGIAAFIAAALVVGLSMGRKRLNIPYEMWQASHGILSVALIGFAVAHIYGGGRYAAMPVMRWTWAIYLLVFVGMFLRYRLLRPLSLRSRPWEVVRNHQELGNARTLVLRPVGHDGFRFEPGQFGWIGFGRSPFAMSQHPISFSSNGDIPEDDGCVAFTIKSLGDWSGEVVPKVQPGTRAWIDGPHGVFTIDREEGAGYVLIGGGVGITPIYSMAQALASRDDVRPVFIFHGANEASELTFGEELAELAASRDNIQLITVLVNPEPDWAGERGFITPEILRSYLPEKLYKRFQYFICGPAPLMDAMEDVLPEIGVPAERVHTERFDMV